MKFVRTFKGPRARAAAIAVAGAATIALASCGHDDGGPPAVTPPTSNQPPASASQSVDGFIAFLKVLVVTMPNNTEPLDVSGFVAPTTETGVPDPGV